MQKHPIVKNVSDIQWLPNVFFGLIAIAGIFIHTALWQDSENILREDEDVYYTYLEGQRIIEGENPYERILEGNMRENNKYATYFPFSYLLSSFTQFLGMRDFSTWLEFWNVVFLAANLGISFLLYNIAKTQNQSFLGIFGVIFWLFNRWTLHVTFISHLDFVPLFLLLLSLYFIPKRFYLACILFGLSLAFKQIAIFALPLYLIWSWQTNPKKSEKHLFITIALIGGIPLIMSIPFLIWNFKGFVLSILFSVTRLPASHFETPSLDALFGFYGLPAKLPLLILLGMIYFLAYYKRVLKYSSILLVMAIFINFNSVIFRQYFVWFVLFIPLTVLETIFQVEKGFLDVIEGKVQRTP